MKGKLPLFLLALLAAPSVASAAGAEWISDFAAARKLAAKENKHLLIDFTGSDWCTWCIRLKKEVFDQAAFREGVADKFVLVELDFPQDQSKIPAATRKQNEELAEVYAVQGYPTIVLADARGRPYGRTGYQPGGPDAYLKHLAGFAGQVALREKAFAEAKNLKGVEKARALLKGLGDLDDAAVDRFFADVAEEITAADPSDESGFMKGRGYRQAVSDYEKKIEGLFVIKQYGSAINAADAFLAEHEPTGMDKQNILMAKVMAYVEVGRKEDAFKVMDEIREAAPESELSGQLDGIKVRIEQYIKQKNLAPPAEDPPAAAPGSDAPAPAPAPEKK